MLWKFESCFIVLIAGIYLSGSNTLQRNPFQCGFPRINTTKFILHGHETEPGAWPWHAALYHKRNGGDHYACGGTLISEQFVLTAAHCLFDTGNGQQLVNNRIFVRLGVHDLDELNVNSLQQHRINKIYKHPNQKGGKDLRNDIAILEFRTVAQLNDYVQPACLSISTDLTGVYGTVVGWGFTENDEVASTLRSVLLPVVDTNTCLKSDRDVFGKTLDEGIFCAGYTNGTGVCNGDSGSGIFFKVNNAWHLGGIVSFGRPRDAHSKLCHANSYGAFTKVYTYLPWISLVTSLKFLGSKAQDTPHNLGRGICNAKVATPLKTNTNHSLPLDCGVYVTNRIARGSRTDVFDFPWMAIINFREVHCYGTFIHKRYILTTAGCTLDDHDEIQNVTLGEHNLLHDKDCSTKDGQVECAPPVRVYGIECIIRHQNYNSTTDLHDIALIRLDRDVQFEIHIQPICLPVLNSLRKFYPQRYIITGWNNAESSDELHKGVVTSADRSECQKLMNEYGWVLDESQLCVGRWDEPSWCNVVGGPLGYSAWYNGIRFIQFGIASYFQERCNGFTIYTNVAYYMDWIIANIQP